MPNTVLSLNLTVTSMNLTHELTAPPSPLGLGPLAGRGHCSLGVPAAVGEHLGGRAGLENVNAHDDVAFADGDVEKLDSREAVVSI